MTTVKVSRPMWREFKVPIRYGEVLELANGAPVLLSTLHQQEVEQIAEALKQEFIQHCASLRGAPRSKK